MTGSEIAREVKMQIRKQAIEQYLSGTLLLSEAATLMGVSYRQGQRIVARYRQSGEAGISDRRQGQGSDKRSIGARRRDRIIRLKRERYADFTVKHFHEDITAREGITASYKTVLRLLQEAGLVQKQSRRGRYRKARKRQPARGMRMHLDSSMHAWLGEDYPKMDLTVALDDADGRILHAHFAPEEGMDTTFVALKAVIRKAGAPLTLYTDRGAHFCTTTETGKVNWEAETQVQRALKTIGIRHLVAYTPQARGRSERVFRVLQDRLVNLLKQRGITDYQTANDYLQKTYMPAYNKRFGRTPESQDPCFFTPHAAHNIDLICAEQYTRIVKNDFTISWKGTPIQLPDTIVKPKHQVIVHRFPDNTLAVSVRGTAILRLNPASKVNNTLTFVPI